MKVNINWLNQMHFQTETGTGHNFSVDAAPEVGGQNLGPRPTELLLSAVGTCSGIDIVNILKKMRQKVDSFDIEVTGDRQQDHPRRFVEIHILYRLAGDLNTEKVIRAVRLSLDKYCSVSNSLNAKMMAVVEINGERFTI